MKIIYIVGDGRSGSTILDSIIGNAEDVISVGECCRFWVRFYEKESLCGCLDKIEECKLWNKVDKSLYAKFDSYNPKDFLKKVKFILYYKNFKNIPSIVNNEDWKEFCDMVRHFYKSIYEITKNTTIIDSTKFPNWGHFLIHLDFCDVKMIHLERNLQSVANSWKKKVLLPEYPNKRVLMPIKSNYVIIKSWIKIKYLCSRMKSYSNYFFINYEGLCANPNKIIDKLEIFLGLKIDKFNLTIPFNHSIGGNPVRNTGKKKIVIKNIKDKFENLNIFEVFCYKTLNVIAKFIFK